MRQDVIEENERKQIPHFQEYLFNYLHDVAPTITKDRPRELFNLVVLFGELIRHDIFSHQCYVSSLISRGEVSTSNKGSDNRDMGSNLVLNKLFQLNFWGTSK